MRSTDTYDRCRKALEDAVACLDGLCKGHAAAKDRARMGLCVYNQAYVQFMKMRLRAYEVAARDDLNAISPARIRSQVGILKSVHNLLSKNLDEPDPQWRAFKKPLQDAIKILHDELLPLAK